MIPLPPAAPPAPEPEPFYFQFTEDEGSDHWSSLFTFDLLDPG
jgi:hypothetical protein